MSERPPKLILTVIDGCKPEMLERAISSGRAPALAAIMERGTYVDDCVAAFPSVTPACAASIATGVGVDEHLIPSMNWYHREESRYVEYGSSFSASRQFGFVRSLTDTIYNMNLAHLSTDVRTVFEHLDDAGVRTAGTTYLMYRGRHRHEVSGESALARLATSTLFRHAVYGPKELFYADIFASRKTGCRGQLGLPGARDQHSGCVGAYMIENDLFDFMLFSLPDNDTFSHKRGPHAQVTSIAEADRQLERLMHAAGGPDAFFAEYAMIVLADHAHALVEALVPITTAFEGLNVLTPAPSRVDPGEPEIAVCPSQRSAQLYILDEGRRDELVPELVARSLDIEGVDVVMHSDENGGVFSSSRGELRFSPGGDVRDERGDEWSVEGDLAALEARIDDGTLHSPEYPDALRRAWAALTCSRTGDVLISAGPGYEFIDWGGQGHIGAGSHGSLHHSDSLGPLLWCGRGPSRRDAQPVWTLRDVVPMVCAHFGLED
ncbi:MAG: alkaline phosphatase family protein [Solirubrobacteraceae bacterium]